MTRSELLMDLLHASQNTILQSGDEEYSDPDSALTLVESIQQPFELRAYTANNVSANTDDTRRPATNEP